MSETLAVDDALPKPTLTPHVRLKSVIVVVNPLSGGVGSQAVDEMRTLLAEYSLKSTVLELTPDTFEAQLDRACSTRADAVIVLAGDGTAGTIAERAGPKGPLVAPLPGGTMNMLPKALYGTGDWKLALRKTLESGTEVPVSGGRVVDGTTSHTFFCAAIFGSPALWAPAREAVRTGRLKLAWLYGMRALRRAFTGRLRYTLKGERPHRAEALVLITPTISRVMTKADGLEAAAMNTAGATEAFRLAAHALFDDWRSDPAVQTRPTTRVQLNARSLIPAVIDGEPMRLDANAEVVFEPLAFRALAPAPSTPEDTPKTGGGV